jgi:hypothetical protein
MEMKINNRITWVVLILLTTTTALISEFKYAAYFIIGISVIKSMLVAFQFMELKYAHPFWKTALPLLILLLAIIILLILQ